MVHWHGRKASRYKHDITKVPDASSELHVLNWDPQGKDRRTFQRELLVVFRVRFKIKVCRHSKMQLWQQHRFWADYKAFGITVPELIITSESLNHSVDGCTYTDLELASSVTFSSCAKNCLSKGGSGWPDSVKTNRAKLRSCTFCPTRVIS